MDKIEKKANKIVGRPTYPSALSTQEDLEPKSDICEEDLLLLSHQEQGPPQGDQSDRERQVGSAGKQKQPSLNQCIRQVKENLKTTIQNQLSAHSDFPMVRFDGLWLGIQSQFDVLTQSSQKRAQKMSRMKTEILRLREEIRWHQQQMVENSQKNARIHENLRDYLKEVVKLQGDEMDKSDRFSEALKYLITVKELIDSEKGHLFNSNISDISKDSDCWNHSFGQGLSEVLGYFIDNSKVSFSQSQMENSRRMLSKLSKRVSSSSKAKSQRSAQNEEVEQRETTVESSKQMEGIYSRLVNSKGREVESEPERVTQIESINLQGDLTTASSELPYSYHDDPLYHESSTLASDMIATRAD